LTIDLLWKLRLLLQCFVKISLYGRPPDFPPVRRKWPQGPSSIPNFILKITHYFNLSIQKNLMQISSKPKKPLMVTMHRIQAKTKNNFSSNLKHKNNLLFADFFNISEF
jgi:hypothetical protein